MATKIDQKAISMETIYNIRLDIKGSDKEYYTKEELLDLLDEIATRIRNEEE